MRTAHEHMKREWERKPWKLIKESKLVRNWNYIIKSLVRVRDEREIGPTMSSQDFYWVPDDLDDILLYFKRSSGSSGEAFSKSSYIFIWPALCWYFTTFSLRWLSSLPFFSSSDYLLGNSPKEALLHSKKWKHLLGATPIEWMLLLPLKVQNVAIGSTEGSSHKSHWELQLTCFHDFVCHLGFYGDFFCSVPFANVDCES